MAPNVVVLLHMAGLFLLDLLFLADIRITQDVPATMAPGSEVRVTVHVDKGDLSGFAKLQFDLPEGFSATAIETKGASFTFSDNKAKFIWMALPSSPSFKISYTLSAGANVRGTHSILGRLSYIENNERKTYDMPGATIDLGSAPGQLAANDNSAGLHDLASAGGAVPTLPVPTPRPRVAPMQGPGNVGGIRTITPITENEMLVEVEVNKGAIRGFGKLQETIPPGFTAMEKTSDEAIFTVQDRYVKFVWLNLPAREKVKVVYKLRANGQPDGEYTIDGEFGYLLNDETQRAVLGSTHFLVGSAALVAHQENAAQQPDEVADVPVPVPVTTPATQPSDPAADAAAEALRRAEQEAKAEADRLAEARRRAAAEAAQAAQAQNMPPSGQVPTPETGITYKVQITAAHTQVGRTYFRDRHKFNGEFGIENHQGWVKYVTGRFTDYKQARDRREALIAAGHNFPGPFVTAYNNGERITVQEALMISNQRWLP